MIRGYLMFGLAVAAANSATAETLRYMSFDPVQLEAERPAIAAFEASHPGLKVQAQALPQKDYWTNVSAQAASGTLPDVMMMSSAYIYQWAASGNLADLNSFAGELNLEGYTESAVDVARVKGGYMLFPKVGLERFFTTIRMHSTPPAFPTQPQRGPGTSFATLRRSSQSIRMATGNRSNGVITSLVAMLRLTGGFIGTVGDI